MGEKNLVVINVAEPTKGQNLRRNSAFAAREPEQTSSLRARRHSPHLAYVIVEPAGIYRLPVFPPGNFQIIDGSDA